MTWITILLDKLFFWLPRLWLIEPDEAGIRTTLGKYKKICPAGWYVNWPIIHICAKTYITPQVVDLRAQSVLTNDGHSVAVSGAIEYSIKDVEKALLSVTNIDVSLPTFILGVIADHINSKTFEECHDTEAIKSVVRKQVANHVNDWGIKVRGIYITDIAEHQVYRVLGPLLMKEES